MTYAIISSGAIQVRALPSRRVAVNIQAASYPDGRVIIDPRCIQR